MKKLYSLIRACMTSDMKIFKIKTKKNSKKAFLLPLVIGLYLMFMIWGYANTFFEKMAPIGLGYIMLSLFVFGISFMTFMEGIYKIGSLIFNCKDDELLLSLPIKKSTVLFVRVFKFYVFELLFNSLFLAPIMIAYIRWGNIDWTYYLTSIIMLLLLPIIPIVLSLIAGTITSSLSSRFKYKNAAQIVLSMLLIIGILFCSYNMDGFINYLMEHATSVNDFISKLYYPAGAFAKLVTDFNVLDLIIFILVNIVIFIVAIFILSKFYFKINSRLKGVTTTKKTKISKLIIERRSSTYSLVKKELNVFFKTPVFIINAGFALVLYLLGAIVISLKFDSFVTALESMEMSRNTITNNISIVVFLLISFAAYMTSITNAVISLEGKNISILKSLPIKTKTILLSKIYAGLVITTPVFLVGDIILFIRFKISIIESLLLIILSILIPLVSHFIGILINLKYPKLDWESTAEVVKQSASSFIAVMMGMVLLIITFTIVTNVIDVFNSTLILLIAIFIYIIINAILYLSLISKGVKEFNSLSI